VFSHALGAAAGAAKQVKRICVVVTARPSWAKLEPVCRALKARPDVELQIVACASALLERYGRVVDVIKAQGYSVTAEVWSTYEGANLVTSAKETGALCSGLAGVLPSLRPDVVVVCADRHEVLAVAQASAYLHVPLAHLQGGERTGSIDDRVRDSITALADLHFPATELAGYRVYGLTGSADIFVVGCPSLDLAKQAQDEPPVTVEELGGAGAPIDLSQPFALVLQHPVTSEADQAHAQMCQTLGALYWAGQDAIVMWPGQDAGAEGASKAIREEVARGNGPDLHTVRNLPPNRFLRLLTQCAVLVGNSSAGIREASYLGVPVVNVGSRQFGRQRGPNVVDVPHDAEQIAAAIQRQIAHGRYPSSSIYGTGDAGTRIAEVLSGDCGRTDAGGIETHRTRLRLRLQRSHAERNSQIQRGVAGAGGETR
jgi:UDP-hydrolysing UDP-N-acetyl-D-glucosamine 2-epimerase